MKHFPKVIFVLILLIPTIAPAQQTAQEKKMMEVWSKLAEPGEHHKHIGQFHGNWNVNVQFRMSPNASVQESTGTCEKKMVLGGRYLSEHCTTRMKGSDKETEGIGFLGYDNFKKNYLSLWMTGDSTMVIPLYGTCDGKGKMITVSGDYNDPVSGKTRKSKWIWTVVDQNKHTLKLEDIDPDNKDNRSVDVIYTRK